MAGEASTEPFAGTMICPKALRRRTKRVAEIARTIATALIRVWRVIHDSRLIRLICSVIADHAEFLQSNTLKKFHRMFHYCISRRVKTDSLLKFFVINKNYTCDCEH